MYWALLSGRGCFINKLTYRLFGCLFLSAFTTMSIGPVLQSMGAEFSLERGQMGLIFTFLSTGLSLGVLACGYIGERTPNRFLLIAWGCVVVALSCSGLWLAKSLPVVYALFFTLGVGLSALQTISNVLCASLNPDNYDYSLGVLHIFSSFGGMVGPIGCALLLRAGADWRWIFTGVAVGAAALGLVMFLSAEERRGPTDPLRFADVRVLLHNKLLLLCCLGMMIYVGLESGVSAWMPTLVHDSAGISRALSAISLTVFSLAMTLGRLTGALIVKKYGALRVVWVYSTVGIFAVMLLATMKTPIMAWVAVSLIGLAFSPIFAGILALGTSAFGTRASAGTAMMVVSTGVGGMLVPAAVGYVSDFGGFSSAIVFLVAVQVGLVLNIWRIGRNIPSQPQVTSS